MALIYTRPGSTVTVDHGPGRVIVVIRDGNRAPHVDCRLADDPAVPAEGIGRGLLEHSYSLAA
jgi:hypothetical protein